MQDGEKAFAFSWLIYQPTKKQFAFWATFIETEIDSFQNENCLQIKDLLSKFKNFDVRLSL